MFSIGRIRRKPTVNPARGDNGDLTSEIAEGVQDGLWRPSGPSLQRIIMRSDTELVLSSYRTWPSSGPQDGRCRHDIADRRHCETSERRTGNRRLLQQVLRIGVPIASARRLACTIRVFGGRHRSAETSRTRRSTTSTPRKLPDPIRPFVVRRATTSTSRSVLSACRVRRERGAPTSPDVGGPSRNAAGCPPPRDPMTEPGRMARAAREADRDERHSAISRRLGSRSKRRGQD